MHDGKSAERQNGNGKSDPKHSCQCENGEILLVTIQLLTEAEEEYVSESSETASIW